MAAKHEELNCIPLGDFTAQLFDANHLRVAQALQRCECDAAALADVLGMPLIDVRAHVHRLVGKGAVDYHVQGAVPVYFLTARAREQLDLRETEDTFQ